MYILSLKMSHLFLSRQNSLLVTKFIIISAYIRTVSAISCTAGTYSLDISSTSCISCANGTYSDVVGASSCIACAAGKYATKLGSTSCVGSCTIATYHTMSADCGKDFDPTYYNCGLCTCQAGYYYELSYDGKYYNEICMLCPIGTYSSIPGATVCTSCEAGKYFSTKGATNCMLCDIGKYSSLIGSVTISSCTACAAGQYSSVNGATVCTSCEAGTYGSITGAINCTSCGIGKYLTSTGALTSSNCSWCEAGTYSSVVGASICTLCSEVTYITAPGSTACTSCAPGTYSTAIKRTACTNVFTWNASNYPNINPSLQTGVSLGQGGRSAADSWFLPVNGVGIAWSSPWVPSANTPTSPNGVWYLCSGINNPASSQPFLQSVWSSTSASYITFTSGVSNEFYFPHIDSTLGFVTFEVMCASVSCGSSMYVGVDINKNGKVDATTAAEKGCGMSIGNRAGSLVAVDGTISAYNGNSFGVGTSWYRYRLLLDIQAGTMRVDYKSLYTNVAVNDSQWITQLPFINSKFNWGATTAQNPSLWDSILFSSCRESAHIPWFVVTTYPVIGAYFNTSSLVAEFCAAGTYWVNSSLCQNCPMGSYASATGMSGCSICEIGTYAITERSSSCTVCEDGKYSSVNGATDCTSCAPGTYSTAIKRTACTNVFTWSASNYPNINPSPQTGVSLGQGGRSATSSWFLPVNGVGITWSSPWVPSANTPTSPNGVWYLCSGTNNPASGQPFLQSVWSSSSASYITFTSGVSNAFYFPPIVPTLGFVTFEVMCATTSCKAAMNFGVDLNGNNNIETVAEKGCGMSFGDRASGSIIAADGTSTAYIANTLGVGTSWYRYRLLLDIQAGTMRVDYKSLYTTVAVNDSQWITQIQNISAKFNWGATTPQNPSLWNGVMFTSCKESVHMPWFIFTNFPVIGTYFNTSSLDVEYCAAGTYWVNSSNCQNCPIGTYSSAMGMSVCTKCETGTYAPTERSLSCTDVISCEAGTYFGSNSCVPCSTGSYSGNIGSTMCTPCEIGKYADTISSSVCSTCEYGTYTPDIGSYVCSQCSNCSQIGYYTTGCGGTSPGTCDKCTNT